MSGIFDFPTTTKPGLFIAGTDLAIGKTVIGCAIADVLTRYQAKVGVLKPFDTQATKDRGNLVSSDAQALAHFAQLDPEIGSLSMVAPIAHQRKLDPALELMMDNQPFDASLIARSLSAMDQRCDIVLVEGIGGIMTPIDPARPHITTVDLARELGYPVIVVTKSDRGSLSQAASTVFALRSQGCFVAGLVVNFYRPDHPDNSMQLTREFLARMNRLPILATVPEVSNRDSVNVAAGHLHDEVRAAVALADWRRIAKSPQPVFSNPHSSDPVDNFGRGSQISYLPPG